MALRYTRLRHALLADIARRADSGRGQTMRRYPDDRYLRPAAPDLTDHERYAMNQLDAWGLLALMYSGSDDLGEYVAPSTAGREQLAKWNDQHGNPLI